VVWSILYPLSQDDALSKEYLAENSNVVSWLKTIEQIQQVKDALSTFPISLTSKAYQALSYGAMYLAPITPIVENGIKQSPQHQPEVVTNEELEAAKKAWLLEPDQIPKLKNQQKVV
jgi:hypothetical protein